MNITTAAYAEGVTHHAVTDAAPKVPTAQTKGEYGFLLEASEGLCWGITAVYVDGAVHAGRCENPATAAGHMVTKGNRGEGMSQGREVRPVCDAHNHADNIAAGELPGAYAEAIIPTDLARFYTAAWVTGLDNLDGLTAKQKVARL